MQPLVVDFGSQNIVASRSNKPNVELILTIGDKRTGPTKVTIKTDPLRMYCNDISNSDEDICPNEVIVSFKKLFGKQNYSKETERYKIYTDKLRNLIYYDCSNKKIYLALLVAIILNNVRENAERKNEIVNPKHFLVVVPDSWGDIQRRIILDAGKILESKISLINATSAQIVDFMNRTNKTYETQYYTMIDSGCDFTNLTNFYINTTKISKYHMEHEIFINSGVYFNFGASIFTQHLLEFIIYQIKELLNGDRSEMILKYEITSGFDVSKIYTPQARLHLWNSAEATKKAMLTNEIVTFLCRPVYSDKDIQIIFHRDLFLKDYQPAIDEIERQRKEISKIDIEDFKSKRPIVELCGGGRRFKPVSSVLEETLNCNADANILNTDECFAEGAAWAHMIMTGGSDILSMTIKTAATVEYFASVGGRLTQLVNLGCRYDSSKRGLCFFKGTDTPGRVEFEIYQRDCIGEQMVVENDEDQVRKINDVDPSELTCFIRCAADVPEGAFIAHAIFEITPNGLVEFSDRAVITMKGGLTAEVPLEVEYTLSMADEQVEYSRGLIAESYETVELEQQSEDLLGIFESIKVPCAHAKDLSMFVGEDMLEEKSARIAFFDDWMNRSERCSITEVKKMVEMITEEFGEVAKRINEYNDLNTNGRRKAGMMQKRAMKMKDPRKQEEVAEIVERFFEYLKTCDKTQPMKSYQELGIK